MVVATNDEQKLRVLPRTLGPDQMGAVGPDEKNTPPTTPPKKNHHQKRKLTQKGLCQIYKQHLHQIQIYKQHLHQIHRPNHQPLRIQANLSGTKPTKKEPIKPTSNLPFFFLFFIY